MKQVILIAHGNLATEMKNSAQMLFGQLDNFHTINFYSDEGLESLQEKILKKIEALKSPVLIFADMFGGTPYNASCAIALKNSDYEIEIVSGMSLPLVLELAMMINSSSDLSEIAMQLPELVPNTVKLFTKEILIEDEDEL